jgi:protocatechuate 4,5-dioxygenase, beta chain
MAEIVGAFLIPHNPLMVTQPSAPGEETARKVTGLFASIRQRIIDLRADTVITIGADHCGLFGPPCTPSCLIGVGDVEGPMEPWLGIARTHIQNNTELASHILATGQSAGIDWAFATSLLVDHSTMVPVNFCVPIEMGVRTIPIYLNDAVKPFIPSERARYIGESIRRSTETWPGAERIVVLGTGGVSHWVGAVNMGEVNPEFDLRVLDLVVSGSIDELAAIPDDEILRQGGNGAIEIKNWICALAAVPEATRKLLGYFAVREWISGIGFVEIVPQARDDPETRRSPREELASAGATRRGPEV